MHFVSCFVKIGRCNEIEIETESPRSKIKTGVDMNLILRLARTGTED